MCAAQRFKASQLILLTFYVPQLRKIAHGHLNGGTVTASLTWVLNECDLKDKRGYTR